MKYLIALIALSATSYGNELDKAWKDLSKELNLPVEQLEAEITHKQYQALCRLAWEVKKECPEVIDRCQLTFHRCLKDGIITYQEAWEIQVRFKEEIVPYRNRRLFKQFEEIVTD